MIYAAVGRRERGKTTLVYSLARKVATRVIFDPRGQIDTGAPRITRQPELEQAFARLEAGETHEILITPAGDVQSLFEHTSQYVADWVRELPDRPIAFVVDEARFVDLQGVSFEWICRCAPRDLVHIFITAHRPIDLSTNVRAILDHWLMFHCVQEHDLKVIRERCGVHVAGLVSNLKKAEWIQWDDGAGEAFEHREPAAWYVELRPRRHDRTIQVIDQGEPSTAFDKPRLFG